MKRLHKVSPAREILTECRKHSKKFHRWIVYYNHGPNDYGRMYVYPGDFCTLDGKHVRHA